MGQFLGLRHVSAPSLAQTRVLGTPVPDDVILALAKILLRLGVEPLTSSSIGEPLSHSAMSRIGVESDYGLNPTKTLVKPLAKTRSQAGVEPLTSGATSKPVSHSAMLHILTSGPPVSISVCLYAYLLPKTLMCYYDVMSHLPLSFSLFISPKGGPLPAVVQRRADPWNGASKPATIPGPKNRLTFYYTMYSISKVNSIRTITTL